MDSQKTIIIAEDETDLLEIFSFALKSKGFNVLNAQNGKEAVDLLEGSKDQVDLILLDIIMPKMDGLDALKKIRSKQKFQQTKIIMLTNLDSPEDRRKAIELGANDFLVKSAYTPSQLADAAMKILA